LQRKKGLEWFGNQPAIHITIAIIVIIVMAGLAVLHKLMGIERHYLILTPCLAYMLLIGSKSHKTIEGFAFSSWMPPNSAKKRGQMVDLQQTTS